MNIKVAAFTVSEMSSNMYAPMLDFYAKMAAADRHYVTLDNHEFAIASHTEIKRGRSAIMYTQN